VKGRPLIVATIGWLAGSSLAYVFSGPQLLFVWSGLTLLLTAAVLLRRKLMPSMLIAWIALTLSGAYWLWYDARNVTVLPEALAADTDELNGMPLHAEGVIVSSVDVDGDRADLQAEFRKVRLYEEGRGSSELSLSEGLRERVMVQVKLLSREQQAEARTWQRGDRIKLDGTLELPGSARNFGAFDYAAYLRTQHIHWLFKTKGTEHVQTLPPATPWSTLTVFRWNDVARSGLGDKIGQIFREPHAGYMKGLLIGMQDDINPETYMQFSQLGLTHILAISGMHVAVFVASLLFIFSSLKITREKSLLITMLLIPVYVLLSGVSPSVVRAGIMGMIGLYAARKGWLKDGLNVLAAAALAMMLWNPYYLLSVSFQLSFLVTAGLMVYVPLMSPLLRFLPKRIAGALNVTLVAQLVSFPLTVYYFNQFSLLSFAANFVLVPFISFLTLPLGAASLLLGWIWLPAGRAAGWVTELTSDWTFRLVRWLNGYPQFVTIWKSPSFVWIAAYFVLMYLFLYIASRQASSGQGRRAEIAGDETAELEVIGSSGGGGYSADNKNKTRSALAGIMLAFLFLLYWEYRPSSLHGAGLVQFLDVGQGDSILITTPKGRNILVDGGGTVSFRKPEDGWKDRKNPFEVGAKVVVPLLKQRGIHHLDAVIVTHGDQDHAGGLQAVLEQIPVKAFLFNGTLSGTKAFDKLMDTALARRIPVYAVHQGMKLKPDKHTELAFILPMLDEADQEEVPVEKSQNHLSVAFVLTMNERRLLFTGDMDQAAEEDVLNMAGSGIQASSEPQSSGVSGVAAPLPEGGVDVIKIAHHGSKSSSGEDWLHYWRPKAAVISAGVNNLYGHPHADVVRRIENEGSRLFRTDQNGEVQMRIRPEGIQIRSKLGFIGQ